MAEEDAAEPQREQRPTPAAASKPAPAADWDAVGRDLIERHAGILAQLPD